MTARPAPGQPGIPARWTSSAKSGVGTAPTSASRVWFTVSHGILNEIYYPRVDHAATRDFGLIVTDGRGYFSEEKRDAASVIRPVADGVPAFVLRNEARDGRYVIDKLVLSDPRRDVVLQRIRFKAPGGAVGDFRLFALLAPHLVNRGAHNNAWLAEHKGREMLFASGSGGNALALGCSAPWRARSVGFVGTSDGWQDLTQHYALEWRYDLAEDGNVALTGEIDLGACGGEFMLALGFGRSSLDAAHRVIASLNDGVDAALADYSYGWRAWQDTLLPLDRSLLGGNPYRISTAVLRTHEASSFPGGIIASLSIPWGFNKGDEDLGGYHLVWPRDLVETAGGLIAAGAFEDAKRVLYWLETAQEQDGHWPQNCWLDGAPYWSGVQMDETAFPILLVDLMWREGGLRDDELRRFWRMARRAAEFVVRNGPVTGQDRWEEDGGYSPFTLAVEIAALLAAADLADHVGEPAAAVYLRETADIWNDQVERWTYVTGTPLAAANRVEGYYVRIAPAETDSPAEGFVAIKNRPPGDTDREASAIVSPDALALVRFGLRAADDPRIRNTVAVIDALLKVELPAGPCWRRYNGDGYGEHEDGGPFDGTGIGRLWPLLAGERAHYELAAGRVAEAERLLCAFEACGSDGHLLPEQVWDADDIPERELFRGRPSGSAMPLVWAHAEHIKLLRSLREERVFDMPPQAQKRYQTDGVASRHASWRPNQKAQSFRAGKILRVEVAEPALVHWSCDGWRTQRDLATTPTPLGTHVADLDSARLAVGDEIVFTLYWSERGRWDGQDYRVKAL